MNQILLFGAGKSAIYLIEYLARYTQSKNMRFTIADRHLTHLTDLRSQYPNVLLIAIDVNDKRAMEELVASHNWVVSLLPAFMHIEVAQLCLRFRKHLFTASYISPEMKQLHEEARNKGLLFLNEMGLDPGIDHMSAFEMIASIKHKGGEITGFESYTGGLVAPESDNNPWHYKFSWNPMNVIKAGQGNPAVLKHNNQIKHIPYQHLFSRFETIEIDGYGSFEGYANRDSLKYTELYGLENAATFVRGTLRKQGFCLSWNMLVNLGLTDDNFVTDTNQLSYRTWIASYLPENNLSIEENIKQYLRLTESEVFLIENLRWLGLFSDDYINKGKLTNAQILLQLLEEKWKLNETDRDMIVMYHQLEYKLNDEKFKLKASLVVEGENSVHTAMAKTVGLPLAIALKLFIEGKFSLSGVQMPNHEAVYTPVLEELKQFGVSFNESTEKIA